MQVSAIIDSYRLMAKTLVEFQLVRWTEFSHEQQLDLNAYQNSLLSRAHDLQTRAVNPAVDQGDVLTETIQQSVLHTRERLQTIDDLPLALSLGALIVALASYVARANRKGIQSAVNQLRYLLDTERP